MDYDKVLAPSKFRIQDLMEVMPDGGPRIGNRVVRQSVEGEPAYLAAFVCFDVSGLSLPLVCLKKEINPFFV